MKEKIKLNFLRLFDNPLLKYRILKRIWYFEFLTCNDWFALFRKIKKGSGTSFWCTFSAWVLHKKVLYLILYQQTKFQCHALFLSQDIKENVLLIPYLDRWTLRTLRFFLNQPLKQWLTGSKRGEDEYTKNWISQEWKELFSWN